MTSQQLPSTSPGVVADLARRAGAPGFERWRQQVKATGGCVRPVHLVGSRVLADGRTGEVLDQYSTNAEPDSRLLVACKDRREARCPACSAVYKADMFQLVRAGLIGGKGVAASVADHPRVFATLTAPSFGRVHTRRERGGSPRPCHPRRGGDVCEHGRPRGCPTVHAPGDALLGQPICPDCYDYNGAVLWQAHAPELWRRFTIGLHRNLAAAVGLDRSALRRCLRISYVKVAEYQRRGLVHFHALVRLDGAAGPDDPPPDWATAELLAHAVHTAAAAVAVTTPAAGAIASRRLRFGAQLDVRTVANGLTASDDQAMAAYLAKYATKSTESAGGQDWRVRSSADLAAVGGPDHTRRMVLTAWRLGGVPAFADLGLRRWAHMLGYRGHVTTKSRRYSTTLTALRQARAEYRANQARERLAVPDTAEPVAIAEWRYAGRGHSPGELLLVHSIADGIRLGRHTAREADPTTE